MLGFSHITFWVLMVWAWVGDAMPVNTRVVFLVLWFVGLFGLPLLPYGEVLFSPLVAILDIILVFMLFKGDIRIR
jgi:hypothetical protein